MKQLQNNFTTPEQSKRMLELGVPADSADCILFDESEDVFSFKKYHRMVIELPAYEFQKQSMISGRPGYLPCWSVGRLMEIMQICSIPVTTWYIKSDSKQPLLEFLFNDLETSVFERNIDFSKLED